MASPPRRPRLARQELVILAPLAHVFAVDALNGQLCLTALGRTWRLEGLAAADLQLLQAEQRAAEKAAQLAAPS